MSQSHVSSEFAGKSLSDLMVTLKSIAEQVGKRELILRLAIKDEEIKLTAMSDKHVESVAFPISDIILGDWETEAILLQALFKGFRYAGELPGG